METAHFYVLYGLSGVIIALCAVLLLKIKNVTYLLEQPVVKKMSPQLNLKPVKVDDAGDEARRSQNRAPAAPNGMPQSRGPRPEGPGHGRDGHREPRPDRAPRAEGGEAREPRRDAEPREPRRDGERGPRERSDRDRGDRFRDRDRGGRGERNDRHGGDRGRRPEFASGEREPSSEAPRSAPVAEASSPAPLAPLAPRRPLPSTVESDTETKDLHAAETSSAADEVGAADPFFGRDDSDIQHGRRNQMKKKPRFEVSEEESKETTEETKA